MLKFKPYNPKITPSNIGYRNSVWDPILELESHEQFKQRVVRVNKRKDICTISYFDKNGIFQIYELDESKEQIIRTREINKKYITFTNKNTKDTITYELVFRYQDDGYKPLLPSVVNNTVVNRTWITVVASTLIPEKSTIDDLVKRYNFAVDQKVAVTIKDGNENERISYKISDTFNDTYPVYNNCKSTTDTILENSKTNNEVKHFIYKIERPIFERETDNLKPNTFDFIRIRLSIASERKYPNRKQFVKDNLRDIATIALTKIKDTKSYQKYGIPVNYLKLENASITIDNQLELVFGLKNIFNNK